MNQERGGKSVRPRWRGPALGALLWAAAIWVLLWQGAWCSLRGSAPVAVPLRFEEAHVRQRPWLLDGAAPPAPARTPFGAVYGPNVVRQEFHCPADNLSQIGLWMAGPAGQEVFLILRSRTSGVVRTLRTALEDAEGQWVRWPFSPIRESGGQDFELVIAAPGAAEEGPVVLRAAPGDRVDGLAHLNLYPVPANLDFAAYHRGWPGRWWLDAISARWLPEVFRLRVQQYKPDWVGEHTLGALLALGAIASWVALGVDLGRGTGLRVVLFLLAAAALTGGVAGLWERAAHGRALAGAEGLDLAWVEGLASQPHATLDLLLALGEAGRDLTRSRDRGQAWAEAGAIEGAPRPALVMREGYRLAWRTALLPGSAFRAALAPVDKEVEYEVWVTSGGAQANVLRERARAGERARWVEADLGAFAGRDARIELRVLGGDGAWVQPRILTEGQWLQEGGGEGIAQFGPIQLLGSELERSAFRPGETLRLDLAWGAASPVERNVTGFVHLVDEEGRYAAGQDGWPVQGAFPTTLWRSEAAVIDRRALSLPADLPSGTYRLGVGWYELETMVRLPAIQGEARLDGDVLWLDDEIVVK